MVPIRFMCRPSVPLRDIVIAPCAFRYLAQWMAGMVVILLLGGGFSTELRSWFWIGITLRANCSLYIVPLAMYVKNYKRLISGMSTCKAEISTLGFRP